MEKKISVCSLNCFECPYPDCKATRHKDDEKVHLAPAESTTAEHKRERSREYYKQHRETVLKRTKSHYYAHRDEIVGKRNEYHKEYYKARKNEKATVN